MLQTWKNRDKCFIIKDFIIVFCEECPKLKHATEKEMEQNSKIMIKFLGQMLT